MYSLGKYRCRSRYDALYCCEYWRSRERV